MFSEYRSYWFCSVFVFPCFYQNQQKDLHLVKSRFSKMMTAQVGALFTEEARCTVCLSCNVAIRDRSFFCGIGEGDGIWGGTPKKWLFQGGGGGGCPNKIEGKREGGIIPQKMFGGRHVT